MSSKFKELFKETNKLGNIQKFIPENLIFEVRVGSQLYGTNTEKSDNDIMGVTIPPKSFVFPHTAGYTPDFDKDRPNFHEYQRHHINYKEDEYDFTVYSVVKFVNLLMDQNPNQIDALFAPDSSITFQNQAFNVLRENRHKFLAKDCYHRYRGYSASQKNKIEKKHNDWLDFKSICDKYDISYKVNNDDIKNAINKTGQIRDSLKDLDKEILEKLLEKNPANGKRKQYYVEHQFDRKYAYHLVRLMLQAEQILVEHDLDLRQNKEILKNVRDGSWSKDDVLEFFERKEKELDKVYHNSDLPTKPDTSVIRGILIDCLEEFYGNLDEDFVSDDQYKKAIYEIKRIVNDFS